jgi:hypothetical protein
MVNQMKFRVAASITGLLLATLPAIGQDSGEFGKSVVKFSSAAYDAPAFSALFPAGQVKTTHETSSDGTVFTFYEIDGKDTFLIFSVLYWDLPATEAPTDTAAYLDKLLDKYQTTKGGEKSNSTLSGMFARSTWLNGGIAKPPQYSQYDRITVQGHRVWRVDVMCQDPWFNSCTETDANKFFDSLKIK